MVINDPTAVPGDIADRVLTLECRVKNLEERELDYHRRLVDERIKLQAARQRALAQVDYLAETYWGNEMGAGSLRLAFREDCNKLRGMIMATCPD